MIFMSFEKKLNKSPLSFYTFFIFCIALILLNKSYGQKTKFDSIFYHTAVNVTGTDPDKALIIADSLYQHTPEDNNKIRALMLTANIYSKKGQINKSIDYALKANLLAEKLSNFEWVARISGFLSTQYRTTGIKSSGLNFLTKGLEASQKITNVNTSNMFQALAYQEKAYYQMEDEAYLEAIGSLNKAGNFFKALKEDNAKYFLLATNEELLGKNSFSLDNFDFTKKHYLQGLVYLEKASGEDSPLKGFIYNGLGKVFFKEKNNEKAHDYFLKALTIAEKSDFSSLKIESYKDLSIYHDAINDMANYKYYNDLYNQLLQSQIEENKQSADGIVKAISNDSEKSANNVKVYLYALAAGIIILSFLFYFYGVRKKREKKQFQRIVKTLRERSFQLGALNAVEKPLVKEKINSTDKQCSVLMSPEVEQVLIDKLRTFELGDKFTDNNISLASLSTILDTNSKYLSYVINNYKGKDFNTYINELRVLFITRKIENETVYAQYKISYLAEEAGFSSHSKFSAVFKSVVGLSPSVYLEQYNSAKKRK